MISLRQLADVCRRLNGNGVKYVLIGGWAIYLHGYERATRDIDILIDDSEQNVSALKDALKDLLPEACNELRADDVRQNVVVRMAGEEVVVDLIRNVGDQDYAKLNGHVMQEDLDGVKVPFADLESMLKLKSGVRDIDKRDYLFLKGKMEYLKKSRS